MMKKMLLCALGLMMISGAAYADTKASADGLQPDLRKILEEQAIKESKAWKTSNVHYAQICLKGVESGKPVPKDKAVASTECYIKQIEKNVAPVALNTTMVDDMTDEWRNLARQYGSGKIDHKTWMADMEATQKKFAQARIVIIKELVKQAQQQQKDAQVAAKKAAPSGKEAK